MEQNRTAQELVQAGIRRCWEAAGTSNRFRSIYTGAPLLLSSTRGLE